MSEVPAQAPAEPAPGPSELARVVQSLSDEPYGPALAALAAQGISTPTDLHFARSFAPHADLPNSTITTLRTLISSHLVQRPSSALELYHKATSRSAIAAHPFRTGLPPLDALLATRLHSLGGHPPSRVTQLCGPSGSYRTLLALHAAISFLLLNPDQSCCWIDSCNRFGEDVKRAREVALLLIAALRREGAQFRTSTGRTEDEEETVLKTLERLSVSVHQEAESALEVIDAALRGPERKEKFGMVVIDGIDILLGDREQPGVVRTAEAHASLVEFMRRLRTLAREHALAVLVINSVLPSPTELPPVSVLPSATREAPSFRPALGVTFSYMTDLTLLLTKGDDCWGRKGEGSAVVEVVARAEGRTGDWIPFKSDGISLQPLE